MLELVSRVGSRPAHGLPEDAPVSETTMLLELLSIAKTTRAFYGLKLAELGFYNGQDELLVALGNDGVTVSSLAEQMSVRPSTVSKMVDRLIERELCERTIDERDARRTLVRITPAGVALRQDIDRLREDVEADLMKHLDADVSAALKCSLRQCSAYLAQQLRRIR